MGISSTIKAATAAVPPGVMLVVTQEQLEGVILTIIDQRTAEKDEVLDVKGVAALLGISQSHAYNMAQSGELPKLNMSPLRFSKLQVLEALKK